MTLYAVYQLNTNGYMTRKVSAASSDLKLVEILRAQIEQRTGRYSTIRGVQQVALENRAIEGIRRGRS